MFFVLDENGNRIEGYDKESFLSVLKQAIENGDLENIDAESAFVSKLKCCVGGGTFKVAFVTQAKYNELKTNNKLISNTLYFITDDDTAVNLEALVEQLRREVEPLLGDDGTLARIIDGRTPIKIKDQNGEGQELKMSAGVLKVGDVVIPQRKLLWEGISSKDDIIPISDVKAGDTLELVFGDTIHKIKINKTMANSTQDRHISWVSDISYNNGSEYCTTIYSVHLILQCDYENDLLTGIKIGQCYILQILSENQTTTTGSIKDANIRESTKGLSAVYKIIE